MVVKFDVIPSLVKVVANCNLSLKFIINLLKCLSGKKNCLYLHRIGMETILN